MSTDDHTVHRAPSNPCPDLPDLEERMQMVLLSNAAEENDSAGESFVQRSEWYYHKRPQVLALLQDLHNSYLTLLDRHHHLQRKHLGKGTDFRVDEEKEDGSCWSENSQVFDSEAESCLTVSCLRQQEQQSCGADEQLIGDILAKDVENDVLVHQMMEMDRHWRESGRKIELLKKLLELLETERLMLSEENARLGYKVNALREENKALHSDAMLMKRKALELGRSILKMREDHRVCMFNQKNKDLQQQIHSLEKRNDEYHQQLMKRDDIDRSKEHKVSGFNERSVIGARQVRLVGCFQMDTLKFKRRSDVAAKRCGGKLHKKWWEKGRMMDLFMCGLNSTSTGT